MCPLFFFSFFMPEMFISILVLRRAGRKYLVSQNTLAVVCLYIIHGFTFHFFQLTSFSVAEALVYGMMSLTGPAARRSTINSHSLSHRGKNRTGSRLDRPLGAPCLRAVISCFQMTDSRTSSQEAWLSLKPLCVRGSRGFFFFSQRFLLGPLVIRKRNVVRAESSDLIQRGKEGQRDSRPTGRHLKQRALETLFSELTSLVSE